MSYDLFFAPTYRVCGIDEFLDYFNSRPNYKIEGAAAYYFNEYTGVYFSFEYNGDVHPDEDDEEDEEETDDEQEDDYPIAFNINFYRPSYFGLEAANELVEFVAEFELDVLDPQSDDEEEGFSAESFLRGWNAGNRFAYRAILGNDEYLQEALTYPTAGLHEIWKWNYERDELQNRLGDDIFVPRIYFMKVNDKVVTTTLWPDAIPVCLPKVDFVLVLRKELSSQPNSEEPEVLRVAWKELASVIETYPFEEDYFYRMEFEYPEDSLCDFVSQLPLNPHDPEEIQAYDSILDEELVNMARAKR